MARRKETTPVDMTVEEKLKNLYQLQCMLSEIDKIRILRGELPLEVEDLEDEIEGLKTRVEKSTAEVAEIRQRINEFKTAIDLANRKLEEYKTQLDNVRNNREYDLLNKEIEFQTLEVELAQKRIREGQAAEMVYKATLEERTQDLEEKKNELDEIVAETKAEEEKLRERAKNLELLIEPRLLQSFKRIRKNSRNGLGIVYVQRDACGGCFAQIPPQRQLDVRMRKKIIVCEYCGRILIDPELAGVKIENAKAEKPKRKRSIRKKSDEETE